jgi:hypothetical protein
MNTQSQDKVCTWINYIHFYFIVPKQPEASREALYVLGLQRHHYCWNDWSRPCTCWDYKGIIIVETIDQRSFSHFSISGFRYEYYLGFVKAIRQARWAILELRGSCLSPSVLMAHELSWRLAPEPWRRCPEKVDNGPRTPLASMTVVESSTAPRLGSTNKKMPRSRM